jgi:hypothetical protein
MDVNPLVDMFLLMHLQLEYFFAKVVEKRELPKSSIHLVCLYYTTSAALTDAVQQIVRKLKQHISLPMVASMIQKKHNMLRRRYTLN